MFRKCPKDCTFALTNGEDLYEKFLERMTMYSTGLECMDGLLDGGVMGGEVVEIFGPVASGKTQFALTFSSSIIQNFDGNVLYVDTTGSFSPFRLTEMLLSRNPHLSQQDLQNQLCKFIRVKVANSNELIEVFEGVRQNLNNIRNKLKAIVVDHVGTLLSSLVPKDKITGFNRLMVAGRLMKIVAKDNNLAILLINQRILFNGRPARPALGQWWLTVPDVNVIFDDQDDNYVTTVKVLKSNRFLANTKPKETFVRFSISNRGTESVVG